MIDMNYPVKQGLYDPQFEKDSCGVGFIANIKGEKSHDIVLKSIAALTAMTHRGAAVGIGSDDRTGDGAGIMIQIPDKFFRIQCELLHIPLPESGKYGIGMGFFPRERILRLQCEGIIERVTTEEGLEFNGWRDVPVDPANIGSAARQSRPEIRQFFVSDECMNTDDLERKLFIIRKRCENEVRRLLKGAGHFYICSLSARTLVYKGLLLADQIRDFYLDFNDINFSTAIAVFHQRYSTNTFPTWRLAHPFRLLAHNGEINTIRGNRNWMTAREGVIKSDTFGSDLNKVFPILDPEGSDSSSLDNILELLLRDGRPLSHAMMMLIPEAWKNNEFMEQSHKDFYEYHGAFIEPWDGPAAITFTDGIHAGAILDRNGLRPARYAITTGDLLIVSSEAGVIPVNPAEIVRKGKLQPGRMILADTEKKQIFFDEEIKDAVCTTANYGEFLVDKRVQLETFPEVPCGETYSREELTVKQKQFGYTLEDLNKIITPMALEGKEPVGSMGNDTPLAVLSKRPQLLFSYFKQMFAQVTNPPIDPIREKLVMSLMDYVGPQENMLGKSSMIGPYLNVEQPVLTEEELAKIRSLNNNNFRSSTIGITFKSDSGPEGLAEAINTLCHRAAQRVEEGYNILILTDRHTDEFDAPIPSLLAVSAVHHYLVEVKARTRASIIIDTGEARETTHFALLINYGATAVCPYLAYKCIEELITDGTGKEIDIITAKNNYIHAACEGILKILSKMGISALQSYRGAQLFEAIGLNQELVNKYFAGNLSRIGGIGINELTEEILTRHKTAYTPPRRPPNILPSGGFYNYRKDGEYHLFNPESIYQLQHASRSGNYEDYKKFSSLINSSQELCTLRGMFRFIKRTAIPIDQVEPVSEIVKRFCTGAMSFGSISKEAHETIAIAMNRIGGRSNSGEGGEDPLRYKPDSNGDSRKSAIKQIASGRFGVTLEYLMSSGELQIKMAQGAKPGEGGQLPGKKVDSSIACTRHSTPGIDLISPPPHHDIYSIEDLAQLIHDLKCVNPSARISVKLVAEAGVGTIAAGVAKAYADTIIVSGHDGGTGASPLSSVKYAGIPWELGLSEAHQVLVLNDLRSRVRLQTDGQLRTGRDVVIAALLGAEEYAFATSALVVMGCTMLRNCHLNTCEMGIATQDEALRKNFRGKPEYLVNYLTFIAMEVREIMSSLGFTTMNEMIGRTDMLETTDLSGFGKTANIDLSPILYRPDMPRRIKPYCTVDHNAGINSSFNRKLVEIAKPALEHGEKVNTEMEICSTDRSVGATLSGWIAKKFGPEGLPEDTVTFKLMGSAGQSFGCFAAPGVTLLLEGETNDYLGKGLSGGKLIIKVPDSAKYLPEENIIAGNTILYGATAGKVFIGGTAGERFAVRNSGASAVVEGVGDHCCEYMTGGVVVILGKTGRNFAAGMSGGVAYVYDPDNLFPCRCNREMVEILPTDKADLDTIKSLLTEHTDTTNSRTGSSILKDWNKKSKSFLKVVAPAYLEILRCLQEENKPDAEQAGRGKQK